jgi:hypothetical protein
MRESAFYRNDAIYLQQKGKKPPDHYNQADNFQFGSSHFVNTDQIETAMRDILKVPADRCPGMYRTVIMITHALEDDMTSIDDAATPPFNMKAALVTKTIELQTMAMAAVPAVSDVYEAHERPGLHVIMTKLGFLNPLVHQDNIVHNAGNDAAFQNFCAIKIAYDQHHQGQPKVFSFLIRSRPSSHS